jgi:hypothetical protein
LRNGQWEKAISNNDGIALLGRGLWSAPWHESPKVVAVFYDKKVYWEGIIEPNIVGSFTLQLSD